MADEYIKRKDALDALTADALERNLDSVMTDTASRYHRAAQRVVSVVPAADVAPVRHGRWVNGKCDNCGEHAPYWCLATTFHESNYCPNCGAKMEVQDG